MEGAAPRELPLCPGTHRALGSFAAARGFFSQAALLIAEVFQARAGPLPSCVAQG